MNLRSGSRKVGEGESRASRKAAGASSPARALDEVADALRGEIVRCAAGATEQAILLESVGVQSLSVTAEIFSDVSAHELRQMSHRIRGLVVQGHGILAELQCVAGRLDAFASLKAVEPALEPNDP
jgi:hypothetical protein